MDVTIDQKIQQAVTAHNDANLAEAERLYKEILKVMPANADANHNYGILMGQRHQTDNALPFLLTALEGNLQIEQFWVSYIDALINLNKLDSAKKFIKMAEKEGFFGENFNILTNRTFSPVQQQANGKFFQAQDKNYLSFLKALHENVYESYFEIGTRTGDSLVLSQSPSIAIDPFFQLNNDPIGKKDFCLIFQETSDSFFKNTLPKLSHLKCQLAFIDGMHLFECALRDFINLAKISSEEALFLFHDPIPWTSRMAVRNNKQLEHDEAWTGDIWKLALIFMDAGMKDNISILTSAPSGLLAVLNPEKKIIAKLEENYEKICAEWIDVDLSQDRLLDFYQTNIFVKPEIYLRSLEKISFGDRPRNVSREWVSQ